MITINNILNELESHSVKFCFEGDERTPIEGFSSLDNYKSGTITWAKNINAWNTSGTKEVACIVCRDDMSGLDSSRIIVDNPKRVFFMILDLLWGEDRTCPPIGVNTILGKSVLVGDNVVIGGNCCIDGDIKIGSGSVIGDNVTISGKVCIGNSCRIESGVVIGCSGGGFYLDEEGNPHRVPHFGGVIIGNRVEIGCNSVVDRGTIDDTVISDDVKITSLVAIGHNSFIGRSSVILSGAVVCGSAQVGERSYIAPGGIIKNHVCIGSNSLIGMNAVLEKNEESNSVIYKNKDNSCRFPDYRKLI